MYKERRIRNSEDDIIKELEFTGENGAIKLVVPYYEQGGQFEYFLVAVPNYIDFELVYSGRYGVNITMKPIDSKKWRLHGKITAEKARDMYFPVDMQHTGKGKRIYLFNDQTLDQLNQPSIGKAEKLEDGRVNFDISLPVSRVQGLLGSIWRPQESKRVFNTPFMSMDLGGPNGNGYRYLPQKRYIDMRFTNAPTSELKLNIK